MLHKCEDPSTDDRVGKSQIFAIRVSFFVISYVKKDIRLLSARA